MIAQLSELASLANDNVLMMKGEHENQVATTVKDVSNKIYTSLV